MNNKCVWDDLTNQYSLSKTLRFELKPIGDTLKFIKEKEIITLNNKKIKGLIEEDRQRESDFNKVKKIMDDFYKFYINKVLISSSFNLKDLEEFNEIYNLLKKDKYNSILQKHYYSIQKKLRDQLYDSIKKDPQFSNIFSKKMITDVLPIWLHENNQVDDLEIVKKFNKWTTYFKGFFENRKNVFSKKEIPTSIIYRIVHDNLPKYLDNLEKINVLLNLDNFDFTKLENEFALELNNKSLFDFFAITNFNSFFNQKGIELYNLMIGGKTVDNIKIQGLNELINLHSQTKNNNDEKRNIRRLKLTPLFNQILSDKHSFSDKFQEFKNNQEVIDNINCFYNELLEKDYLNNLKKIINDLDQANLEQIYIRNDRSLTDISNNVFKDYSIIKDALKEYAKNQKQCNTEKKLNSFLKQKYFSIFEIQEAVNLLNLEIKQKTDSKTDYNFLLSYFKSFKINNDDNDLFSNILLNYNNFKKIKYEVKGNSFLINNKNNREKYKNVNIIKSYLDSMLDLLHFLKPIYINLKNNSLEDSKKSEVYNVDSNFYNDFNLIYEDLLKIIKIYNQTRNYITKKPFSTKKFKLNFKNPTLLDGWDKNKEIDNFGVLFRDKNKYFLGILTPENKKILDDLKEDVDSDFTKMVYKLLPDPNRMLIKVFFSKKNIEFYNPSNEIIAIRNHASHTKDGAPQIGFHKKEFNLKDCHKFINFLKDSLYKHSEWNHYFNFKFKETEKYNDISEFYKDVSDQSYSLNFLKLDYNKILDLVNEGKLYLFQIYNKDFSKYSKGKKNLHTLYWEELFSKDNLKNVVYKLNGDAEIFYRDKSLKRKVTHKKNEKIKNKNPIKNKTKSVFSYDLIKDKRYTEDKFLFHCPISLNFKEKDNISFNKKVNNLIKSTTDEINILSIDRGERHLLYYTLLDSKGNIIEQNSLNSVFSDFNRKYNYRDKLDSIEGERDVARKNWHQIKNIKEIKKGYLSQIVHKISKLAVENNAIIVLEDLNFGFKRGRFKIEKQVYQNFEKALIDKLNYLVFKDRECNDVGGTLKAYQLTNKFESFKKLGKQSGIIFYVPASYTSRICPKTGFTNFLYPKFINKENAKNFILKFEYIKFHKDENLFEFNVNYSKFKNKKDFNLIKDNWSIWSYGGRLINFKNKDKNNQWDTKEINLTNELKCLFDSYNINYVSSKNIITDIVAIDNAKFYDDLFKLLRNILQLRNSKINSDEDYILSCIKDDNGLFFDSRIAEDNIPKDADANGAYHIGLKGLMVIDRIKKLEDNMKLDLKISKNDYLNFILRRIYNEK